MTSVGRAIFGRSARMPAQAIVPMKPGRVESAVPPIVLTLRGWFAAPVATAGAAVGPRVGVGSGERDGRGQARLVTVHRRGVALAGRILHQARVTRPEDMFGTVAETDLE